MLLLPIVNEIDNALVMENNIILSAQLGGGIMSHIDTVELGDVPESEKLIAYLDVNDIEDFRASGEQSRVLQGVFNPGDSCIFLNAPGVKNAAAKFIRDNGDNLPVSGLANVLSVSVGKSEVRCWYSSEGEIKPAECVMIDPASTIYERNAGLTETTELRGKTVTLIGCGSLGSTMALSLARAGAGRFRLFDPDRLSPVNIARHHLRGLAWEIFTFSTRTSFHP